MVFCPSCKIEINELKAGITAIVSTEPIYHSSIDKSWNVGDSSYGIVCETGYLCPYCNYDVTDNLEEAISFLKGELVAPSLIIGGK